MVMLLGTAALAHANDPCAHFDASVAEVAAQIEKCFPAITYRVDPAWRRNDTVTLTVNPAGLVQTSMAFSMALSALRYCVVLAEAPEKCHGKRAVVGEIDPAAVTDPESVFGGEPPQTVSWGISVSIEGRHRVTVTVREQHRN